MDFRMLGSLQHAIPVVFRHLDAYVELVEQDLAMAKAVAVSRLRLLLILGMSGFFALLMVCAVVIALTWDGQYRILAIALMLGVFALAAIGSATSLARKRHEPFAAVKREWRADRELLNSILSREDSHESATENMAFSERA